MTEITTPNWYLGKTRSNHLIQDNAWGSLMRGTKGWRLDIEIPESGPLGKAHFNFPSYKASEVQAFPEIIEGRKFGTTDDLRDSPFPKKLGDCKDITINVDYEMQASSDAQYNVAIETFFHDSLPATGPGHPSGENNVVFELMVWFCRPVDTTMVIGRHMGAIRLGGRDWDVYTQGDKENYIAFVMRPNGTDNPRKKGQYSVKWFDFVLAADAKFPNAKLLEKNVAAIEFGPELWTGTGVFTWNGFAVDYGHKTEVSDGPAVPGCLTREDMHALSKHHHALSVEHNKIAHVFESAWLREK